MLVKAISQHPKLESLKHSGTFCLLLVTELEMLATLDSTLRLVLAYGTLEAKGNLFRSLRFLVEDWLCLPTETGLLSVVAPLALSVVGRLASLILGDALQRVLPAFLFGAIRLARLRDDNLSIVGERCRDIGIYANTKRQKESVQASQVDRTLLARFHWHSNTLRPKLFSAVSSFKAGARRKFVMPPGMPS